ncbi:MAG: DoxX family protein [Cyclobacteriaceae bacterium]|nr:DoxX family protein [Cyclobacteriaceae bacterium]
MKIADNVVRWFVGVLFIFSGLVKLNDPVGTAIKMEEYFEVFATDIAGIFHYLVPMALYIGLFVVILEILLGVALLFRWKLKLTIYVLLGLIVFFTFLTFYSAAFNKVTDCGCFGDAIALTPWQSFGKDILLLLLTGYMVFRINEIKSAASLTGGSAALGTSLVLCIILAYVAIEHLPIIDFRPYKVGVDIRKAMQPSEDFRYRYIMEREGEKYKFDTYPTDNSYKFVEMILLNPEAEPKIKDYNIWNDEGDFTEASLTGNKLLVIFSDVNKARIKTIPGIMALTGQLQGTVETWVIMANDEATYETFRHEYQIALPYYFGDGTVLKTIVRSVPGLLLLKDGVILGKWHNNDIPSAGEIEASLQ